MQNCKDVLFGVKIETFWNSWPLTPKPPKFAQFWSGQFSLDFAFNIGVSGVNTPYSSSEPNKDVIVNRQCGGEKLKYVPKFCVGVAYCGHVASRIGIAHARWRFAQGGAENARHENAGHEIDGPIYRNLQGMKLQDLKMTDQCAGHELLQDMKLTDQYARHEIAGHENAGHTKAKQKTSSEAANVWVDVILINCNLAYAFST